jgi:hypothetical protein
MTSHQLARRAGMASMLLLVAVFSTACTADQVLTILKIIGWFV